jgi:hypothetical protein
MKHQPLVLVLAALVLGGGCTSFSHFGKLRHVVLFKFKDGTTKEQTRAIEAKFGGLPSRIPSIVGFEWGTDVSVEDKADGFTHCFVVTFEDAAGRAAYLPHPAHKEFVELLLPSLDKVLVVDYVAAK